jgi:predicted ATP-grasp superfamily ATP-dependent carboligase
MRRGREAYEKGLGPPAIVLGSHVTALGVLRALGRAGVDVRHAGPCESFVRASRWYRPLGDELVESADTDALAAFLARLPLEQAVVFPCSDLWATAAASLTRERFVPVVADRDVVATVTDKAAFGRALEELGVPHPRTRLARPGDDADVDGMFVKPVNSQVFFRRYGVKAWWPASPAEAASRVREAAANGLDVLLQEYVPGPPTSHYFVDGYVSRDGRLVGELVRRRLRMYPPRFGNSTYMVTVAREQAPAAVENVRRLVEGLGYRGIFSVELKHDERDGEFKVLELNGRPWWYVEFAARCGVDVCGLAYRDVLGLPVEPALDYDIGRRCFYPSADLRAVRGSGLRRWLRAWPGADQPILARDDPLPAAVHAVSSLPKLF